MNEASHLFPQRPPCIDRPPDSDTPGASVLRVRGSHPDGPDAGPSRRAPLGSHNYPAEGRAGSWGLSATLLRCLREGDGAGAVSAAIALRSAFGLAHVHALVAKCLVELDDDLSGGDMLTEASLIAGARLVLEAVQPQAPATPTSLLALAPVPGERHTLGLLALAQLLQEAGYATVLVEHSTTGSLTQLVAHPQVTALVLSAQVMVPTREARRLVTAIRQAAPDLVLVAGGGGFPHELRSGVDLVTDDVAELLAHLETRRNPLTDREREILAFVAEGWTNGDIADELGIGPATVKTHLDRIFAKTDSTHRAAAVARALRERWIE